ncbi:MAG: hypothetical protein J6Y07_01085 [Alphaproteobacteria bacterium]|nr:hypothetical protein [Alphaproteobacteria bacterium]
MANNNGYDSSATYAGRILPANMNPATQKETAVKIFLNTVADKISKLNKGVVARNKLIKVIVIARDRMKNYIDEGGSLNRTIEITTKKGDKACVTAKTLQSIVNDYVCANKQAIEAYDEQEEIRIAKALYAQESLKRCQFTTKKTRRGR